jgi:hypothetical protein
MGAKWWANDVNQRINNSSDEGAEVIRSLEIQCGMGPGCSWCFAEGTLVLMGNGKYMNIESVQVGDSVFTYDFEQKKLEINPVLHIDAPVNYKLIKVVFNNGEEIISTEDHPYYVKDKGWCSFNPEQTSKNYGIETKQIEVSDYCLTFKNNKLKKVKVTQIVPFEKSIKTYNLSKIANSNNYFVNGILVNNESNIPEKQTK